MSAWRGKVLHVTPYYSLLLCITLLICFRLPPVCSNIQKHITQQYSIYLYITPHYFSILLHIISPYYSTLFLHITPHYSSALPLFARIPSLPAYFALHGRIPRHFDQHFHRKRRHKAPWHQPPYLWAATYFGCFSRTFFLCGCGGGDCVL